MVYGQIHNRHTDTKDKTDSEDSGMPIANCEEAEELMRKIEKEEEQLAYEDPDKKVFHLCIVNLVIG